MNKIIIEKLPETNQIDGAKRWVEDKGEFVQISHREDIKHLAYFELKKGFSRASHYHKLKEEVFYVIDGIMRLVFKDLGSQYAGEHILTKGDKVGIPTNFAHILYGVEDGHAIEYSNRYYDKDDAYPVRFEISDQHPQGVPEITNRLQ